MSESHEMQIERYDEADCPRCHLPVGVEEVQDGSLVRYEDHRTEIARLREERDSAIDSFNAAIGRETKLINQLTAMTEQYITERTANAKAHQEIARLRDVCDAAKQVDATWSADEPYPPYMDCVDTDALVGLRTALAGTKEGA